MSNTDVSPDKLIRALADGHEALQDKYSQQITNLEEVIQDLESRNRRHRDENVRLTNAIKNLRSPFESKEKK